MTAVWSYGGGTQSAAIAVLILQGKLPRPDVVVMADTNREKSATIKYLNDVVRPAGINIDVIDKREFATVDLYRSKDLLIPAYTTQEGQVSKMPTFCSNEWKQRVVRRWLKRIGVNECEMWLGMSRDEMNRIRVSDVGWIKNRYPLIFDVPKRRSECIYLVEQFGWPTPPRSACWMCPNMRPDEWADMKQNSPEDFSKAVEFEKEIRGKDEHVWLTQAAIPIEQVDFAALKGNEKQGCMSGMCFT